MELRTSCESCPLTFLSRVNYNRHNTVKHAKQRKATRSSTQEKLVETQEKLVDFWNSLEVEQQTQALSVEGGAIVAGVEIPGPLIKKDLEGFAQKLHFFGQRQNHGSESNYFMAASLLLDIVEAKPSRFPITFEDLSSILNNGSEGTFLLGEVSSVEKAMFEKKDAVGIIDVVARTCFILEKQLLKKECEYSKLKMQVLEEIANEQAQQLIKEEAALKSDQEKKKKKKRKKGQIESNIETSQTEPVVESSQTTESTSETPILVEPSNTNYEVESNEYWYKVVEGGRTVLDEVGLMPIRSLYTTRMLSQMLMEIPVWDGDRFHVVYQKMLRDIILIIVRLERKGIRTGTLGDEDILIILGNKLVEQETQVLNNIEGNGDSKLRVEFRDLVVRLKQREGEKGIPKELANFLDLINLELSGKLFGQLFYHPWLMPLRERFNFPLHCWIELVYKLRYSWKRKLRNMTPSDFDFESEVHQMEDCFKKIYYMEVYNHKEGRMEKIQYENNYVGVLLFCKNVILHFQKDSMIRESVQKRVHDFLGNHFPNLWLDLFKFFSLEEISLDFMFADKEEFIQMSEEPEYRCFIGGLAWSTSDRSLKEAFDKHGKLVEAKVVVDKFSGRSCGFGFVTFDDKKAMEEAIEEMNGIDLDGRTITVEKAQPHRGSGRDYDGSRSHDLDRGRDYGGGRGSGGGGDCFKCGKPGHFARECPSSEVSRGGGGRYGGRDDKYSGGGNCFKCGKPGHFARECPSSEVSRGVGGRYGGRDDEYSGGGGGGCGSHYGPDRNGDRYSGCSRDSGSGDR